LLVVAPISQHARNPIVPVGERVRLYTHDLADRAFSGKPTAVDFRSHARDHDPAATVAWNRHERSCDSTMLRNNVALSGGSVS
jgi:hypothetical protein